MIKINVRRTAHANAALCVSARHALTQHPGLALAGNVRVVANFCLLGCIPPAAATRSTPPRSAPCPPLGLFPQTANWSDTLWRKNRTSMDASAGQGRGDKPCRVCPEFGAFMGQQRQRTQTSDRDPLDRRPAKAPPGSVPSPTPVPAAAEAEGARCYPVHRPKS